MNYIDPSTPASRDPNRKGTKIQRYPDRRDVGAWREEYQRRRRAYLGEPYTVGEVKELHLFRLYNRTQAQDSLKTRRITRDYKFVCDTDAAALLAGGLNVRTDDPAAQEFADRTWRWSRVNDHLHRWCLCHAVDGDTFLEVMRVPRGAATVVQLVRYPPEYCNPFYDATGTYLERVVVEYETERPQMLDAEGEWQGGEVVKVVREITNSTIRVWVDGVEQAPGENGAGEHGLGVVPFVHVGFAPFSDPERSLNAGHAIDETLATLDSLLTQMQAIGNRYADPIPLFIGAFLSDADKTSWQQGNAISLPEGVTVEMLTGDLSNYQTLANVVQEERNALRQALPEFVFAEAGAAASGAALTTRAHAFSMKMEPVRMRFWRALAVALGYALAMSADTMWDPNTHDVYTVEGGPVFPADKAAALTLRTAALDAGLLRPVDVVRWEQAAGIVDADLDPETYTRQAEADMAARDERVAALLAQAGMTSSDAARMDAAAFEE